MDTSFTATGEMVEAIGRKELGEDLTTKSLFVPCLGGRKKTGLTMDPPSEKVPTITAFTASEEVLGATGRKELEEDP